MIDDTLRKLEERLAASPHLSPGNRAALEAIVAELRGEIRELADPDKAESIAAFSESSTREALRTHSDPELLSLSLTGLQRAVREFEASHPRLTAIVNDLCQQLSGIGI